MYYGNAIIYLLVNLKYIYIITCHNIPYTCLYWKFADPHIGRNDVVCIMIFLRSSFRFYFSVSHSFCAITSLYVLYVTVCHTILHRNLKIHILVLFDDRNNFHLLFEVPIFTL